ncbi:MAG: DUF1838 family protein [Pseudomonadota bacterium]
MKPMHRFLMPLTAVAAAAFLGAAPVAAEGFDQDAFDTFVSGRVGDGEPVYWYSVGTIRAYPSGELLFGMEGYDAARSAKPEKDRPLAHQYNRKIYFYKDPESDAILTEWDGAPVEPIAYPYQFITYELKGDAIETYVEQGRAPRVTRLGPSGNMSAKRIGETLVVTAPVYLDIDIPGTDRRVEAFENYDFFFQPRYRRSRSTPRNQLSWVRYGDLPAWAAKESPDGKAIYHLVTWRVDSFDELPERLREHIEANHTLWREPPASLDEIRTLQAPDDDAGDQGF